MSFREKMIWIVVLIGLPPYLWYFGTVGLALLNGAGPAAYSIGGLISTMIWGTVVVIIAVIAATIRHRNQGTMIPDERESLIEKRGIFWSYHLLCAAIVGVIFLTWFGVPPIATIHLLALAFILAEFGRLFVELYGLRRGY